MHLVIHDNSVVLSRCNEIGDQYVRRRKGQQIGAIFNMELSGWILFDKRFGNCSRGARLDLAHQDLAVLMHWCILLLKLWDNNMSHIIAVPKLVQTREVFLMPHGRLCNKMVVWVDAGGGHVSDRWTHHDTFEKGSPHYGISFRCHSLRRNERRRNEQIVSAVWLCWLIRHDLVGTR